MSINKESDVGGDLQIGPTDLGMVRIYLAADNGNEFALDFDPEEAEEIAEELRAFVTRREAEIPAKVS